MSRPALRFIAKPDAPCLDRIITLYRAQGWWGPKDTPRALRRLIAGSHCFALAEADGRLLGMGRAISDGSSDAYIQDVVVAKEARGRGIGKALVRFITKRLRADGLRWIGLIAQDNSSAFYEALGYSVLKKAAPMLYKGSRV